MTDLERERLQKFGGGSLKPCDSTNVFDAKGRDIPRKKVDQHNWRDRLGLAFRWFILAGFGLALLLILPAYIAGVGDAALHQMVYLAATLVAIIGALSGREPPGFGR